MAAKEGTQSVADLEGAELTSPLPPPLGDGVTLPLTVLPDL